MVPRTAWVACGILTILSGCRSSAPLTEGPVATIKSCSDASPDVHCRLLEIWNTDQPSAAGREQFASVLANRVPSAALNPIARCLSASRAVDRGAAAMAFHDCLNPVEPDLSRTGSLGGQRLDVVLGVVGRVRPTGPKVGHAKGCGPGGRVNPYLAQTSGGVEFKDWPHSSVAPPDDPDHARDSWPYREYRELAKEATQKWQQYAEALEHETDVDYAKRQGQATQADLDAAKEATQKALEEAHKAIEKRDTWEPLRAAVPDGAPPPDDGTAVARPAEDVPDGCAALNQFLTECAAGNWASSRCQLFLNGVKGCKSTIMFVDPDQGTGCADVPATIDTATFNRVLRGSCWSRIQPAGPDEDPCAPASVDGAYVTTLQPNPCVDPRALVDPGSGQCAAPPPDLNKTTDILLGRASLSDVVATLEKLCGCDLPIDTPQPINPRAQAAYQVVAWSAIPAYQPYP